MAGTATTTEVVSAVRQDNSQMQIAGPRVVSLAFYLEQGCTALMAVCVLPVPMVFNRPVRTQLFLIQGSHSVPPCAFLEAAFLSRVQRTKQAANHALPVTRDRVAHAQSVLTDTSRARRNQAACHAALARPVSVAYAARVNLAKSQTPAVSSASVVLLARPALEEPVGIAVKASSRMQI